LGLLAVVVGVALAAPAIATTSDAWITTKTKLALLTTEGVSGTTIKMDTSDEMTTFFEIVPSQEAKAAAVADARQVSGVQQAENEGEVQDEELKRAVEKAFDTPNFTDITVEVRNGVVRLTGTVPSWAWRLEAAAVARTIPGVRAVEDDLRFMLVA
jgi:osmotically-inducible protein OsmY